MSIFDAVTSLLPGGSSASGPACGACAAKEIEIQWLNARVAEQAKTIKLQAAVIKTVRRLALHNVAGSELQKATNLGHGAFARDKLARMILKITGWV